MIAFPKDSPVRSPAYLRAVASLPCWRCGIDGFSQACHGDEGKGFALKSSDLTAWPGCGPRQGEPGCHWIIGMSGRLTRDARRELEARAAEETHAKLIEAALDDRKLRAVLVKVGLVK